jgi:hypothetical protein
MTISLTPANRIRYEWLKELYRCWSNRPHPNAFFPAQQVWDTVRAKFPKTEIDGPLAEGVFAHMKELKSIETNTDDVAAVRITQEGLNFFENIKDSRRTKNLAVIGATTGVISLLAIIFKFVYELFK